MSFQYAQDAPEGFTNAIKNVAIVGAGGQLGRNIAEVRQSGLTSVAMMNGFWYEYSLVSGAETFGFDLDGRAVTMYDDGGNKAVNVSTWAHCARAVAALLSLKIVPEDEQDSSTTLSAFFNKTMLVSSFSVSQRDILSSVQRVTGTTDADWSIRYQPSGERHKEGVAELEQGIGQGFFKMLYARIFYPSGDADFDQGDNQKLGLPVEDLDESTRSALGLKK
ncbi:hypothetical protein CTRI78_v010640 [Colletotrichum trifolii]|uniref:NmrA-like domain-containing protein n=1 Tax=Colletotrichum trifolii TaxID=5466 RepID=A0A4V3HTC1_COLTR|nr:hypothetical protein CTRI78_v010640 [Colletotrichum trifolii]